MSIVSHDALWNKAKLILGQALAARDEEELDEFQFKASVTLELLAKAALAGIHPSLVVNPNDFPSMLIACGHRDGEDCYTINAKTLYKRCKDLIPRLDRDGCMALAARRNAYVHSGAMPFAGIDAERWQPSFWRAVALLVEFQAHAMEDLVGAAEAARIEKILHDATQLLVTTVEARIERCRTNFERKNPPDVREKVRAEFSRGVVSRMRSENESTAACPSCNATGLLVGYDELHEEAIDEPHLEEEGEDWLQWMSVTYGAELFTCACCGLELRSYEELEAAEVPIDFEVQLLREPRYVQEYMNE